MGKKTLTIRLDTDEADELAMAARVDARSINEEIRVAVQERLATLRQDPEFQARLHEEFERNRELLEKLSGT